ncbi:MAG: adenylate/guanylate cyclase domain-containing protein [Desulfobacteraceae bacterium IS3]|nr:MAG: adenylate/guanylate cyclase domain-containing protein [Desulfobacteraceae bacterium IS3]
MKEFIKKYINLNSFIISFVFAAMGIAAYIFGLPFLEFMEMKTVDLRFSSRGKIPHTSNVVIAAIDEKSIAQEGKWIWPRSKMAALVEKLSQAGALVVAFDIGFLEPDENSKKISEIIDYVKLKLKSAGTQHLEINDYLEKLKVESDNDRLLAEAIKKSESKIILGYFFHIGDQKPAYTDEKIISVHEENIRGSRYSIAFYPPGGVPELFMKDAAMPQSDIALISNSTEYSGFFNMFPDQDGVVRRIPGVIKFRKELYAPLSFMAASVYSDAPLSVKVGLYGNIESVKIGEIAVPTDESGRIFINYRGGEKHFPHISVTDILRGAISENDLKGKIVLVGATATGMYDQQVSPFGAVFPGVEVHANIIDNILSKDFLSQPLWLYVFDMVMILCMGLFLGIALPPVGVLRGALTAVSVFTGYVLLCRYLFSDYGLILNMVYPLSVAVFVYVGTTVYKYLIESEQKKFIKNAFSTYLSPSVVEELIKSPAKLVLGGKEERITAFFSDVEGFTGISERLAPTELVKLLNEFLTEMTDIILKHKGTVDKFEGDAIIAFFGAPNKLDDQEKAACRACLDMQKRLSELRELWKKEGRPLLKMRIGLFTGKAVVGNMGSKQRMDYTMMGDTVNTGARLEGVNKVYGTYTLIGEPTCKALDNSFAAREIDSIYVMGKLEPITVYELIGYSQDIDEQTRKSLEHYAAGLYSYRNKEWESAIRCFHAALELTPDDGPSRTMLERCNELKENPPHKDWNGVFVMESK